MPKIGFTDHAVVRFLERIAPAGVSHKDARIYLESIAWNASRLKEKSVNGEVLWKANGTTPMLFITKPERGEYVCVTIVPEQEDRDKIPDVDILNEWLAEKEMERQAKQGQAKVDSKPYQKPAQSFRDFRREVHMAQVAAIKAKQHEKTVRHHEVETKNAESARKCLRVAMKYVENHIIEDPEAKAVWDMIAEFEPAFVSRNFLYPDRR